MSPCPAVKGSAGAQGTLCSRKFIETEHRSFLFQSRSWESEKLNYVCESHVYILKFPFCYMAYVIYLNILSLIAIVIHAFLSLLLILADHLCLRRFTTHLN